MFLTHFNAREWCYFGSSCDQNIFRVNNFGRTIRFNRGNLVRSGNFAMSFNQGDFVFLEKHGDASRERFDRSRFGSHELF